MSVVRSYLNICFIFCSYCGAWLEWKVVLQLGAMPVFLCSVVSVCIVSRDFISITALCMGQCYLGIISINALSIGHCSQGVYFVHGSAFPGHVLCSWVSKPGACTLSMGHCLQGMYIVHGSAFPRHVLCSWVSDPRACRAWVYKYHCLVNGSMSYGNVLCTCTLCNTPVNVHRACTLFIG